MAGKPSEGRLMGGGDAQAEAGIVVDWSGRLETAHRLQDEARERGEVLEGMLPNGLPACPVATTLSLIGNRWAPLIIRELLSGTKRFGQLQRALVGVSQKVLTSNLRGMEEAGLLTRTVYPEVPPHVEYSLTSTGFSLEPVIASMWAWGTAYQKAHVAT
jgi:DNA-binding HxlR family transcriptional regulator